MRTKVIFGLATTFVIFSPNLGAGIMQLASNAQITFGFDEVPRCDQTFPEPTKAQLRERQQRLRHGPVKRLFHQTSRIAAEAIVSSGTMKPGSGGLAGSGIYFATSPEDTYHKANYKGVVLVCEVQLGEVHFTKASGDSTMTFRKLLNMNSPKDSVLIPRKNGIEYVVYNTDQIRVIGFIGREGNVGCYD